MPKVKVDGIEVEVPAGSVILQATKKVKHKVPYFCYHKKLSMPANCRQCLVEVKGAPKLLPACYTQVAEGMEVVTESERVREQQRRNMEFILLNHPVDCPICDQAGECKLQDYYQAYDFKPSRLNILPVHKPKVIRLGAKVVLDAERCILCTRCIRFYEEIVGDRPLGTFKRGEKSELGLYPGRELPHGYARNIVDICPVGALTSEDFRFRKRVWFLEDSDSICTGCARGCDLIVQHHEGKVWRYKPRDNEEVNQCWICDDGAYSYHPQGEARVAGPMLRKGDALEDVTWDEALSVAAALLKAADGGRPAGLVLSAQASCEDNYAFAKIAREAVGSVKLYLSGKPDWQADKILKIADQNPNTLGARLIAGKGVADAAELRSDLEGKRLRALLVVAPYFSDPAIEELLGNVDHLVVVATNETPALRAAEVVLAACHHTERDGTFVSYGGRVQRFHAGPPPYRRSGPAWKIAYRLGQKLGKEYGWQSAKGIFEEICREVPAFHDLGWEGLGEGGAVLMGHRAAHGAMTSGA